MKPDKHPSATDPSKPKKWANVRRKFALIVASRTTPAAAAAPRSDLGVSQAESFCRPYIHDVPAEVEHEVDVDMEREFASLTKHNSDRNKEITDPLYVADVRPRTRTRHRKRAVKIVRFVEEPFVICDREDVGDDDEEEGEYEDGEEDEEEEEEELAPPPPPPPPPPRPIPPQSRAGPGFGGTSTIRVVRQ